MIYARRYVIWSLWESLNTSSYYCIIVLTSHNLYIFLITLIEVVVPYTVNLYCIPYVIGLVIHIS